MKKYLALCLAAALLAPGCVKVDNSLGKGLVDKSLLFDTYTVEFPLEEITMELSGDLSAFSDSHLTIGSIRDPEFGLSTREAAFTLIPQADTIDLGTNPKAVSFSLHFEVDTVSLADETQRHILQNLYVTELKEVIPSSFTSTSHPLEHGTELITEGIPVYNGDTYLEFNFTKEFAQQYIDVIQSIGPVMIDRKEGGEDLFDLYVNMLPGIHIRTDNPTGYGGRFNLFDFSCLEVVSSRYTVNQNLAFLKVNSTWNGVQKDSTFAFIPGETAFEDEESYLDSNTKFYQYCYNYTSHSTYPEKALDVIMVEGGGGLKPVIHARELQQKTIKAIQEKGGDPNSVSIIRASIILPFQMPEDYKYMDLFPSILSPTIRLYNTTEDGESYVSFAGLTDASISSEDQGNIDRSNLCYSPDITYHLQEILNREDLEETSDADIWLLTIHTQKVANANANTADNEYYQNLLYASYYNSLYGGYGGYGGYGSYGYGSSYSNYYSYMMLAQMMAAQNQQTYSYTTELDKDRFYKAVLNGPSPLEGEKPTFVVTFAIAQEYDDKLD